MKYTPLDLSFLSNQQSPQADSIRNTAAMIMANAGWSKPSQATLKEMATANKKAKQEYNSAHKQTFLSGVFDLLSTPLYGLMNSLDESIAGHQESSNDNVLEDAAKTVGGLGTGLVRGIGAGLRGSTAIVDALPGVDINDEWQSDPTDKTHLGDVMIRQMTGMSTMDALKPENLAATKQAIEDFKKKNPLDKSPALNVLTPFLPNPDDPEFQQKLYTNTTLTSLPMEMVADPLNFLLPGAGALNKTSKASKAITEGLDAARASEASNPIISGLKLKNTGFGAKAGLNEASPVAAIAENVKLPEAKNLAPQVIGGSNFPKNVLEDYAKLRAAGKSDYEIASSDEFSKATGGHDLTPEQMDELLKLKISTPGAVNLPEAIFRSDKSFKTIGNLGRREIPVQGVAISGRDQQLLWKRILSFAKSGKKGWAYDAADLLRKHPNVEWTETEKLLQQADNVIKKIGQRGIEGLAPALRARITHDANEATKAKAPDVERRLINTATDVGVRATRSVLKKPEAILANKTIRKFEAEILHTAKAPGTYEGLAKAIARGDNVRYSGPQQVRMWNHINTLLNKVPPAYRYQKATKILKAVENYFITKGAIPHSWSALTPKDGLPGAVPLRLSQVAEALGPKVMAESHAFVTGILRGDPKSLAHLNPDQLEALNSLRASEATAAAPATQKGIQVGKDAVDAVSKMALSVGRKKALLDEAQKAAKITAAASGGGDVGAHVAGQYVANLIGKSDPINAALNSHRLKTEAWLAKTGKTVAGAVNDPDFLKTVTNAIAKASDLPSPASLSGVTGAAARVADWLGARFNAAYGVQDMRPIYLRQQASAMETTARRARLINELGRRFPPSDTNLWHEAFRAAQQNGVASGQVAELQSEIAKTMENLFGGTGLRSGAISDSTVVGRNRLLLDELNKNLKRFGLSQYQFVAKKVTDAAGVEHDFSKGLDWMKSWEAWKVTNPYVFLHKVQNAIEHTVREKNMFDEMVSRFASPNKAGGVKYGVDHARLKGFYFTAEGAKQAKIFVRMLEEVSTPNSKSLQYFDHVLSKLKASLTIYIPGHHMTNLIGDMYYNWIAGVNKPQRYEQAIKVMLAQKGRYGEFAEIGKPSVDSFEALSGPQALEQAVARSLVGPESGLKLPAQGNKVIITMQNGTKVTADMIYTAAFREGILPSAKVLEDVTSDTTSFLDKFRPLGGRGQRTVHEVSEIRDHIPRLAQFIDGIAKHKGSFASAVESSARSVRKWHPDGLDITKFERTVMKRVFPFYSWTRKAIPLAIESAVFAGPKVMAYPRLMEAIGLANGVDPTQQVTDAFPGDQMFPDWVRNRGIGPIMGGPGSYSVINPSTPVLDIFSMMGQPGQSAIDMLNPIGKVPIETAQGQTLGRGAPIQTNQQWLDYFTKQIPVASQIGRASGQLGVSDSTRAQGFPNWTNILNLLTGAKMVNTGQYQKSAQFDLRDYLKQKGQQQGR